MKIKHIILDGSEKLLYVTAIFEDGSRDFLYSFNPKKYFIQPRDLQGKTKEEAIQIKLEKERALSIDLAK